MNPPTMFVDSPDFAIVVNVARTGYEAVYSLMQLYHPWLQSAIGDAQTIPRQRRSDTFGNYVDLMVAFFVKEAHANPRRLYSDEEQLDVILSNLSGEWKTELTRLIKVEKPPVSGSTHLSNWNNRRLP